ncbi:hypothetical protein CSC62_11620 [Pseudoxanthomonas jiangsuensis]|nr:hypothetical protein CSC62_11620 [Pseudoxanthomonas jiangsuensis]
MLLLSQGLVAFGGSTMKHALAHFTGTPTKAFVSGTLATIAVQSSTATTVTLIGFVSAGLISFSQAIGVLIGASLGNTATGWIVATLGLKVNLGFHTLPLIGIGALVKLLAKGRLADLGIAMTGFGLMFLGLEILQHGMHGAAQVFDFTSLPSGGFWATVITMLVGLALTAILQSSTAAIATTLTALHAQVINFDQAAAVVVGAAIGTTLTGIVVTAGGTIHARRTALAYVLFNTATGTIAIVLLPAFLRIIAMLEVRAGLDAGTTSLAAFHTMFISVGVLLFLPFAAQFSRLIERILPAHGEATTQLLDASLLAIPAVALEASQRALEQAMSGLLNMFEEMLLGQSTTTHKGRLQAAILPLDDIYSFVTRIELPAADTIPAAQRVAQLHAIDHLIRFRGRLSELAQARVVLATSDYLWALKSSQEMIQLARRGVERRGIEGDLESIESHARFLSARSLEMRHAALQEGEASSEGAARITLQLTDNFRWIERNANHIWRICHYLNQGCSRRAQRTDAKQSSAPDEVVAT